MLRSRVLVGTSALVLTLVAFAGACTVEAPVAPEDAGVDASFIDASRTPAPDDDDVSPKEPGDAAVPEPDTTPGRVTDLAGAAETHVSVKLTWTAPADKADAGTVAGYELRYAKTPIATDAEFDAAEVAEAPAPLPVGSEQSVVVTGLEPDTEYHFVIRARDGAGNRGPLSDDVVVATKPRAELLVSEIAPVNTEAEGGDFVELVATVAGSVADLEIRQSGTPNLLHKFGPLDVAVGDRIVVHLRGLPGPEGFVQEDTTSDKTSSTETFASAEAYDVYSAVTGLAATNVLVAVMDGTEYQDAVPYSNRGRDASATAMSAFASAHAAGAWTFATEPVDGDDDCATLLDVVNASNSVPQCGGWPGFLTAGSSIQRNGVVDTNTRADFFVAPQTRGAENAPFCAPEGAKLVLTEVNPNADLVELKVTSGGSLRNFTLRQNPREGSNGDLKATFPALCAATGDVVVLHLKKFAEPPPSETTAKDEYPAATNPNNYDGAWDVYSTAGDPEIPTNTNLVLAVRDPGGAYVEAAAFSNKTTTPGTTYLQSLAFIQGLGLWLPADCNGEPCSNTTNPTARALAASWNGVGATAEEASCQRSSPTSSPEAASWSVDVQTFGQ